LIRGGTFVEENLEAKLWVNNKPVELNAFIEQILGGTVAGALRSLKGVEGLRSAELQLHQGSVAVTVDGKEVPLTPFPNDIIAGTVTGFVSSLKGIDKIEILKINLRANPAKP
jgi:sulfur carrier protein ThiS